MMIGARLIFKMELIFVQKDLFQKKASDFEETFLRKLSRENHTRKVQKLNPAAKIFQKVS